ncbi:MAG: leucine-rich repeat domain-containing protein [Lachnospiraceae bacterium]|nr:leucine-rich repeat domain-containing protein [Lachnospiraceae bacterium]
MKTPTKTTAGQVYVKQVASTAVKSKTLTVGSSITVEGFTYQIVGITQKAFKSCTALQTVTIKSGATFIGKCAFYNVSTLKTVILPDTVTIIKDGAFRGCTELRQITIPANVTTIRKNAFYNCKNLNAILVLSKYITTIGNNAFKNTRSGCYMVILRGKKTTYRAALDSSGNKKIILYTY